MSYKRNDDFDNFGFGKSNGFNSSDDGFFDSLGGYDPLADTEYDTNGSFQNGTEISSDYTTENYYHSQKNIAEQKEIGNSVSDDYSVDNNSVGSNTLTYSETMQLEKEQGYSFIEKSKTGTYKNSGFFIKEEMYKSKRNSILTAIIVLTVFSLVFVGLLLFSTVESLKRQNDNKEFLDNSFKVYGTVTKIEVEKTDKNFSYRARVVVNAPGGSVVVPNKSFSVKTSVKKGDSIPLLMSKKDIHDVRSESELDINNGTLTLVVVIIVGLTFSAMLVGLIVHYIRFKKDRYNPKYYPKLKRKYNSSINFEEFKEQNNGQSIWTKQIGGKTDHSSTVHSSGTNQISDTYHSSSSVSGKNRKIIKKEFTVKDYVIGGVFGLVWFIVFSIPFGIFLSQKIEYDSFKDRAITIQAQVKHISVERHTSSHKTGKTHTTSTSYLYYATVEYKRDNTLYRRGEFKVEASTNIGDWITVYIDPDNPGDCRVDIDKIHAWNIIPLGLFASVGIVIIAMGLKGAIKAHNKKLRE